MVSTFRSSIAFSIELIIVLPDLPSMICILIELSSSIIDNKIFLPTAAHNFLVFGLVDLIIDKVLFLMEKSFAISLFYYYKYTRTPTEAIPP
jgi:hypothetical protein